MSSEVYAGKTSSDESVVAASNTVALIGLILIGVAAALCALMFAIANQLPDNIADFRKMEGESPTTHLQLLILGCSTAVLTFVAFVLCVVSLFLPNRPRAMAIGGTILSLLVMFGVFGVLVVGVWMNPSPEITAPDIQSPENAQTVEEEAGNTSSSDN